MGGLESILKRGEKKSGLSAASVGGLVVSWLETGILWILLLTLIEAKYIFLISSKFGHIPYRSSKIV